MCLQAARAADDECAKLSADPAARIACFQKARGAELECLDRAMSDAPAAGPGQETPPAAALAAPPALSPAPAAPAAQPPVVASPDVAPIAEPPKAEAATSLPEPPTASISASAPPAKDQPDKDQLGKDQLGKDQPGKDQQVEDQQGKDQDPAPPAKPDPVQATAASPPAAPAEVNPPREPDTVTLRQSSWVVSETTSPVDFSPLITAVIRPASRLQDGPSKLAVRCRRGRTELSIWSEAPWHSARSDAVLVDHRVNKDPIVRQMWSLSADARTATYRENAVELLRSLPEGGLLSISLPDVDNRRREATFLLTGWTAIRQKIEKLCKWPPAADVTYGKR